VPVSPDTIHLDELPADFGRYQLVSLLGEGGMGRVFRAVMTGPSGFRKDVALKVIRSRDGEDDNRGLSAEARIGGLLKHPNIVDVYDYGETDGHPWISMELVHGLDLLTVLRGVRLAPAHVIEMGIAISEGLHHAHELTVDGAPANLVHRDLKPSNVLVTREGLVKVMDFGIAKVADAGMHTATGVAKGTPAYMAPEQAAAKPVDRRADLWALGAILYEMASGEPLLQGKTVIEMMMQLLKLPDRLSAPDAMDAVERCVPGLGAVTARLLSAEPIDRYPDALAIADALRNLGANVPSAPSLRALVRDLMAGGDGSELPVLATRAHGEGLALSVTRERPTPTNISADPTSFVGREEDLARLEEHLGKGARLMTLLGPGGTGKTRLAREFALQHLDSFPAGGAWFVPLDEARTLQGVLYAVSNVLDVPLTKGEPAEQIQRLGRAIAGRGRVLFVLDNFEQVAAEAPTTLARWLEAAPLARFLVTSRELLRLDGEEVVPLGPLEQQAAEGLFVDRATAARKSFRLTDEDQPIIADIVQRLDRLPLAIELAAARVAVLPPRKLRDRLSQRFKLLRGKARGTSARQATLHGAIAWSWDLLDEPERWTLAWCSVFRGGFSLEQAEALIDLDARFDDAPWVLDVVESLRDQSLVRSWETEAGEPRFGMYESIREFADGKLDDLGQRAAAEERHTEVTLEISEGIVRELLDGGGREPQLALAGELENLVAVFERTEGRDPVSAARAAIAAEPHLRRRGPAALHERLITRAAQLAEEVPLEPALAAQTLIGLTQFQRTRGQIDDARATAWRGVHLAEEAGDERLAAELCIQLGYSLRGPDGLEPIEARMRQARATLKALGDRTTEGRLLSSLAIAIGYGGRVREEYRAHLEALEIHRETGFVRMQAAEAGNIAVLYATEGEIVEAEHWMHEALAKFREVGDRQAEILSLGNIGSLNTELGRDDEAVRAIRRARLAAGELGMVHLRQVLDSNLALLRLLQDKADVADELLRQVEADQAKTSPNIYHVGHRCLYRAIARLLLGDSSGAGTLVRQARGYYEQSWMKRDLGLCLGIGAAMWGALDDEAEALAWLQAARELAEELDDDDILRVVTLGEGHVELLRARRARLEGDHEDAFLLEQLAAARLDMVRLDTVRPSLVRLARRLLEQALHTMEAD